MNTFFTENGFAIEVELLAKFLSNNKIILKFQSHTQQEVMKKEKK